MVAAEAGAPARACPEEVPSVRVVAMGLQTRPHDGVGFRKSERGGGSGFVG